MDTNFSGGVTAQKLSKTTLNKLFLKERMTERHLKDEFEIFLPVFNLDILLVVPPFPMLRIQTEKSFISRKLKFFHSEGANGETLGKPAELEKLVEQTGQTRAGVSHNLNTLTAHCVS